MILEASGQIKLGNVILPGIYRSGEVECDSVVDEVSIKGRATKPKKPVGYTEGKFKFVAYLIDQPPASKYDQLAVIARLFKKAGQSVQTVYPVVEKQLNAHGITQVIFKKFKSALDDEYDRIKVTLELWEYVPVVLTAAKAVGTSTSTGTSSLSPEFRAYLAGQETAEDFQDAVDSAERIGENYAAAFEAHEKLVEVAKTAGENYAARAAAYEKDTQTAAAKQSGSRYAAMASAYTRSVDKSVQYAAVDDDEPDLGGKKLAI